MAELTVRIIKTYHVAVDAEFGDTEADLLERAQDTLVDDDKPDDVVAVLLPKEA